MEGGKTKQEEEVDFFRFARCPLALRNKCSLVLHALPARSVRSFDQRRRRTKKNTKLCRTILASVIQNKEKIRRKSGGSAVSSSCAYTKSGYEVRQKKE